MPLNYEDIFTCLAHGGIVAQPSDTCFGLTGNPHDPTVLDRLSAIKRREPKPYSLMVADLNMLAAYGVLTPLARRLAERYLPGALTLVLRKGAAVPPYFNPGLETVGLRIPQDELSLRLCQDLGHALITTSANLSGQPPLYSGADVQAAFAAGPAPDLIIDATLPPRPPSTIVSLVDDTIQILRQGELTIDLL